MSTDDPVDGAITLVAQLMQANAEHVHSITNSLIITFKAERDATQAMLAAGLRSIPFGGTTAQYEDGLEMVRAALHPPQKVLDHYRQRAETWLNGEPERHDTFLDEVLTPTAKDTQ